MLWLTHHLCVCIPMQLRRLRAEQEANKVAAAKDVQQALQQVAAEHAAEMDNLRQQLEAAAAGKEKQEVDAQKQRELQGAMERAIVAQREAEERAAAAARAATDAEASSKQVLAQELAKRVAEAEADASRRLEAEVSAARAEAAAEAEERLQEQVSAARAAAEVDAKRKLAQELQRRKTREVKATMRAAAAKRASRKPSHKPSPHGSRRPPRLFVDTSAQPPPPAAGTEVSLQPRQLWVAVW